MGCLFSKSARSGAKKFGNEEVTEPTKKQYSWDKRPALDPKDYMFDQLKDQTVGKLPGTLNGQQFIIQNCEGCNIYIFDHTATVSIDDCVNCRIFLAPIKTSLFVRDCKDCTIMAACQQFRTRDCQKMDVFLSCVTQPIIEATTGIKFACFQYHYPELEDQFQSAGISVFNNNWSNIHDFTPVTGETNFSLLPENLNVEDYIPLPNTEELSSVKVSTDPSKCPVPRTLGTRRKTSDESCLIVFFDDGLSHERAKSFIAEMDLNHSSCKLVQSKEFTMQPADADRVFPTGSYSQVVTAGPVIGFEYSGDGVCLACQQTCITVSKGSTGLVFVSSSPETAAQQLENFYNFADMKMSA